MKKLGAALVAAVFLVALVPATASANSVQIANCILNANNPTYSGSTGYFVASTQCGGGNYLQIASQENWGAGWYTIRSSTQTYWSGSQTLQDPEATSCGVWYRTWAWAAVYWGGTWPSKAITSNANYRC